MRCNKKSTTFCVHPCQPLLSQTAASSLSLHCRLCPFLFLPLKQPERGIELAFLSCQNRHGGATSSAQGSQSAALTAHRLLVSSRLPPLPAPLGREEGRGAGEGSCPCFLPLPCREQVPPIWNDTTTVKAGGLGARRDCLSPAGLHKCLSCCCQVRKTRPFSQGLAASAAVGYVHPVKMAMAD